MAPCLSPVEHTMKIGSIESKATSAAAPANERKGATSSTGGSSNSTEPSARVQLSAASLLASQSGGADASFDQAKVERISNAIREGRFQVDAGAIADKLIANAQEMLGRARN